MKNKAAIVSAIVIAIVVLFLGFPLLGSGFIPTHDGEYHFIRFVEFFRMLSSGSAFPRWAPTMNSGYGIPIFNFQYPFPDYVAALLHLFGIQFVDSFRISLFIGYALSGLFAFLFLERWFGKKAATVGVVAMLSVPYWFVDIYVRGAIGEVWAFVWIFAGLAAISRRKKVLLAMSIALLVLSHNILAMVFFPVLLVFSWFVAPELLIWMVCGILMSAFFWFPAIWERNNVVGLNTVDFHDHFAAVYELLIPSWGTEFSAGGSFGNKMSFQLGILPVVWMVWSAVLVFRERNVGRKKTMGSVLLGVVGVIILMLPQSHGIWEKLTPLQLIQYPWRLLSFVIPVVGVSAAYVSGKNNGKLVVVLCVLGILLVSSYARPVIYARRDDAYYLSRTNFTDGTSSMGNSFSTVWTPWKDHRPASFFTVASGSATLTDMRSWYTGRSALVDASGSAIVAANVLYYPGWIASVDGKAVPIDFRTDGTVRVRIPDGPHGLRVIFGETPLRLAADIVSIMAFLGVVLWSTIKRIRS